jgi:hypothetical protein
MSDLNGSTLMTQEDLDTAVGVPYTSCADGIVVWGSPQNANSSTFFGYIRDVLGPMLSRVRSQPRDHCAAAVTRTIGEPF